MIGFGISDHNSFRQTCQFANGAIIGSAFVKALETGGSSKENIQKFINSILVG
jgi:tryptophan synthase alpha chain